MSKLICVAMITSALLWKICIKSSSRFSISPEEMAKVYTALSTEDGYDGFLYDEKCREVKANRSAYEEEEQGKTLFLAWAIDFFKRQFLKN